MNKLLFLFALVACGGQTIGNLDGGNTDSAEPDVGVKTSCVKNADCGSGELCGFATADGCAATGQCFQSGAICNSFSPGCACDGTTINVACNGLPNGYAPAPLAHAGQCN